MLINIAIGFAFVVVMTLLSKTEYAWLNGLLPLFPTFALIGQSTTYINRGDAAASDVAMVGLAALVPYAAYLLSVAFMTGNLGFPRAAALGVALWLACASVIVWFRTA